MLFKRRTALSCLSILTFGLALSGCASRPTANTPTPTANQLQAAYVLIGDGGHAFARALTHDISCPQIEIDEVSRTMSVRAPAAIVPPRSNKGQQDGKEAAFTVLTCEAELPADVHQASIAGQPLPLPAREAQRIVFIGDSGCRMKASENAFQNCNNPQDWPFKEVMESAARFKPDLVVHVGDYHYRESPCPKGNEGCADSPWGYGSDVWNADFFEPAHALLAAAPWVVARGNHESCSRAGQGWFRFLDPHAWSAANSCDNLATSQLSDFSEPYAVPIDSDTQLIIFDSSKVGSTPYSSKDAALAIYQRQFKQVNELVKARPHNIFISHHPILAFSPADEGEPLRPGNAALQGVMQTVQPTRLFPPGVDAALHGHTHTFEALSFKNDYPFAVITGNAGSGLDKALPTTLAAGAQPAPGATVDEYVTQSDFGFLTLERNGGGWLLTEHDRHGQAVLHCTLQGSKGHCSTRP